MISDPNHLFWYDRDIVRSVNVDGRCNEGMGRVHVGGRVVVNGDREVVWLREICIIWCGCLK